MEPSGAQIRSVDIYGVTATSNSVQLPRQFGNVVHRLVGSSQRLALTINSIITRIYSSFPSRSFSFRRIPDSSFSLSLKMSVPYLINGPAGHIPASERIPVIARPFVSERAKKTLDLVSRGNVLCATLVDPYISNPG